MPSRPEVEILPEPIPFSLTESPAGTRRPGGRFRFLTVMLLLGVLLLSGCETPKEKGSDGAVARPAADLAERKIRVVATIGMITDIVSLADMPAAFEALRTPNQQCKVLTRLH